MLGSKTKRVTAYGKRTHRIVTGDTFSKASGSGRTTFSPPVAIVALDDSVSDASPLPSPVKPKVFSSVTKRKSTTRKKITPKPIDGPVSVRRPLASREPAVSINIQSKQVATPPAKLAKKLPQSPVVDVEIIVLDDEGRTVAKERRMSKTGAQVNPVTMSPSPSSPKHNKKNTEVNKHQKTYPVKPVIIEPSSDSEQELPVSRQRRGVARRRQIVISSDEDEPEEQEIIQTPTSIPLPAPSPPPPLHHSPFRPHLRVSTSPRSECSSPIQTKQRRSSPRPLRYDSIANKPRQLTPIRRRKKSFPQSPGSVISLEDDESDLDESDVNDLLKFADLSISDYQGHVPEVPEYLRPLLQECNQDSPHEFSSFINSFPFDRIVQTYESKLTTYSRAEFRKVGEASYSEVFGIGSVVLKIVPLRDESGKKADGPDVESPPPSDARDILQEIAATRSMGELCEGFTKLLRTYVVRGKYPSLLLSLWDEYNDIKGSESIKPGAVKHLNFDLLISHVTPYKTHFRCLRFTPLSSCQMVVQTLKRTYSPPLQRTDGCRLVAYSGRWYAPLLTQKTSFHSRFVLFWVPAAVTCTHS